MKFIPRDDAPPDLLAQAEALARRLSQMLTGKDASVVLSALAHVMAHAVLDPPEGLSAEERLEAALRRLETLCRTMQFMVRRAVSRWDGT